MKKLSLLFAIVSFAACKPGPEIKPGTAGVITTVAGNGTAGFYGDGAKAPTAALDHPNAVALDNAGNLYIADAGNFRIRKVTPAGIITTIAGNGSAAVSGDGGPASAAGIGYPEGIAVGPDGKIYIADDRNNNIRMINTDGIITTIAGNGNGGYDADDVPATAAALGYPFAVAADGGGNVYIAEPGSQRVRRIGPDGIIRAFAGGSVQGWDGDGGPATAAMLNQPCGVALDAAGNVYIAERQNVRIRKVNTSGIISTIAGNGSYGYGTSGDNGPASAAQLYSPQSIAVDASGNIYFVDFQTVRKISAVGSIYTIAGTGQGGYSGDGGYAVYATLGNPSGIAVDNNGVLYIADMSNNRVRKVGR